MSRTSGQDAILQLMLQMHGELCDIEGELGITVSPDDFRPRIEHFHDAVRDYTSGQKDSKRLTVEWLAYDLSCLRYIESMPLATLNLSGSKLSPHTDMVKGGEGLTVPPKRADRATKDRIADLYKHYGVLFAALLKPVADRDWKDRLEEMNQAVQDLNQLIGEFEALMKHKDRVKQIAMLAQHLEEDGPREIITAFIDQGKHTQMDQNKKMVGALKEHINKKDKNIKSLDKAHMDYSLAQLAIFENSKEMLKGLAGKGANLVGQFVENAMKESQRQMGR